MAERYMAHTALAVNINSETPGHNFQVLHAPVAGILPHSGKELFGIRHHSNGAEYGTTVPTELGRASRSVTIFLLKLRLSALLALLAVLLMAMWVLRSRHSADIVRVGPAEIYPDAARTPGAANPAITQDNLFQTICSESWSTKEIRPPSSYTSALKRRQMRDLGLDGPTAEYEEDHLISLELGGHPTDPANLWPERYQPRPGAREKDTVENYLHRQVCEQKMTLRDAQQAIAVDWYKVYLQIQD
jgi:hypothetical protein